MERVEEVRGKKKEKESRFGKRYKFELKLRCVKLHLEEGFPISLLSKEVGASTDGIRRWVKAYQERGEAGLQNPVRPLGKWRRLPGPVRKKIGRQGQGNRRRRLRPQGRQPPQKAECGHPNAGRADEHH
jgi:transposase-like protein